MDLMFVRLLPGFSFIALMQRLLECVASIKNVEARINFTVLECSTNIFRRSPTLDEVFPAQLKCDE